MSPSFPPAAQPAVRRAHTLYVMALGAFVLAVAFVVFGGHLPDLTRLGIPTMQPCFIDARSISGASVTLAQGLDPLVQNPGDVMGRPMNYPRIWLLLAHLGVGADDARWLALAFVLLFGAGLLAMVPLATTLARAMLLAVGMFSPVVWLGIERGNNDLAVFGLVAIAVWLGGRRPGWASAMVLSAAMLKLFPILALAGLGARGRAEVGRRRPWILLAAGAVFCVYLWLIAADLPLIRAGTYHWNRIGYGIDQLATTLAKTGWSAPWLLGGGIAVVVATLVGGVVLRTRVRLGAAAAPHALAAFLAGAGTYVGTFCLGSSFDYRLVFLLLALPQLVTWLTTTRGLTRVAVGASLGTLLLLLWSMTWRAWLQRLLRDEAPGLMVDEVSSWALALALLVGSVLCVSDRWLPARWRGRPFLDADRGHAAAMVVAIVPVPAEPRRDVRTGTSA